ncbi:cytochrome C [Leptospira perolatii]|uniref:Cytochrome C n=1 Tax=Leptospira perolatii TaxID=2023191 RepID=A0A2M9ZRJ8_9LEPT|nr:cytochrome c [Leptospira perolatii]PJZ71057.1 cytochrome C [Leptospira perolatii]PJZ74589.1 cytochrome C [Leptospira perolatii]
MKQTQSNRMGDGKGGLGRLFCLLVLIFVAIQSQCKGNQSLSPEELLKEKGKSLYLSNCASCHNMNPSIDGSVGPAIFGSSFELLKARIREGSYPPGYTPKRTSAVMPRFPYGDEEIKALEAFLK